VEKQVQMYNKGVDIMVEKLSYKRIVYLQPCSPNNLLFNINIIIRNNLKYLKSRKVMIGQNLKRKKYQLKETKLKSTVTPPLIQVPEM
jgi:hypothetical protein